MSAEQMIAEVESLRDSMPPYEHAKLAREAIDRTSLKRINLVDYLEAQGYSGSDLMRACGTFGKAVKAKFIDVYGKPPMEVLDGINGNLAPVAHYFEADRPLIDEVFRAWSGAEPTDPAAEVASHVAIVAQLNRIDEMSRALIDASQALNRLLTEQANNEPTRSNT